MEADPYSAFDFLAPDEALQPAGGGWGSSAGSPAAPGEGAAPNHGRLILRGIDEGLRAQRIGDFLEQCVRRCVRLLCDASAPRCFWLLGARCAALLSAVGAAAAWLGGAPVPLTWPASLPPSLPPWCRFGRLEEAFRPPESAFVVAQFASPQDAAAAQEALHEQLVRAGGWPAGGGRAAAIGCTRAPACKIGLGFCSATGRLLICIGA